MRFWNAFWFRRVPPHSLAAFRILFGLYLLAYFLRFTARVELLFSNRGVYAPFLLPDPGLPVFWAWTVYVITLCVVTLFVLGIKTTFITPLVLAAYLYYYCLTLAASNSAYDRLNIIILVILCFARLDGAWRFRRRSVPADSPKEHDESVSIWPIRLITVQIAFLYFGAGLWKLVSPYWHTGDMMRWTLAGPWGTGLAFGLVKLHPPPVFFDLLTWGTVGFEMSAPFLLFSRRFQLHAFALGFLFHLSVACLLHIPEFLNCVCAYVLFVEPEMAKRLGNRLLRGVNPSAGASSRQAQGLP